jgi:hypothetical protein
MELYSTEADWCSPWGGLGAKELLKGRHQGSLLDHLGSADELPVVGFAGGEPHAWTENGGDELDDGRLLLVSWQARRGRIRLGR